MTDDVRTEETTIVATYTTRRDAEMAQERLDEAGIQAFISADDAGGMHPQLQRPHGVKLVVLGREAEFAHSTLEDAGLLPAGREGSSADEEMSADDALTPEEPEEASSENLTFSMDRTMFSATGIGYLVVFGLMVLGLLLATMF